MNPNYYPFSFPSSFAEDARVSALMSALIASLKRELDQRDEQLVQRVKKEVLEQLSGELGAKVFTFNLPDLQGFFNETSARRSSEIFHWNTLDWSLEARVENDQASDLKYLKLYLHCKDAGLKKRKRQRTRRTCNTTRWTCNTTYQIRILSQSSWARDQVETFDNVFEGPHSWWGKAVITDKQLQSGYLKTDGSIEIQVWLKVNNLRSG